MNAQRTSLPDFDLNKNIFAIVFQKVPNLLQTTFKATSNYEIKLSP
jgi:hypothetical protein